MIISDILGYTGAFLLSCRFVPLVIDQFKENNEKINLIFLFMEFFACVFLGSSAILINSYPFIICNGVSLLCSGIVITKQIILRLKEN
tara:strand:- start:127 stop:390 length:264 start_codon:yes stop_codon:yes gene_type:complete